MHHDIDHASALSSSPAQYITSSTQRSVYDLSKQSCIELTTQEHSVAIRLSDMHMIIVFIAQPITS